MIPDSLPSDPWRYRLSVPPLDAPGYARMVTLALAPVLRAGAWRRLALGTGAGALFGIVVGLLFAGGDWGMVIVLASRWPAFRTVLDGTWALLAVLLVVMLVLSAAAASQALWRARLLRRLHAACSELHVAHTLRLGDGGLEWSRRRGTLSLSWEDVRELRSDGAMHFLFLDDLTAIWLPDAALDGRREILDYIRARLAAVARP